jgi:hypothetical protein
MPRLIAKAFERLRHAAARLGDDVFSTHLESILGRRLTPNAVGRPREHVALAESQLRILSRLFLSAILAADGQQRSASLTSTWRRYDIDPQFYLTRLLINLPSVHISQLHAWLPDQWRLHQQSLSNI